MSTQTLNAPLRILLVEDEPAWQQGVQSLIATDPHFEMAGVADSYEDALALFDQMRPDVVLLDWKIRGEQDGLMLGAALLARGVPSHRIVLISGSTPSSIPPHEYLFVPKPRLASDLMPLLDSLIAI